MANQKQAAQVEKEFRLVAKFADADGAKLVVLCKQVTSGEFETSVKLQKAGEKRSTVGMRSSFPAAQKSQAQARFNALVADAEKAKWTREQPKAAKQTGFDVMPAAAVAKK